MDNEETEGEKKKRERERGRVWRYETQYEFIICLPSL